MHHQKTVHENDCAQLNLARNQSHGLGVPWLGKNGTIVGCSFAMVAKHSQSKIQRLDKTMYYPPVYHSVTLKK